jgi:hypothetical protein
MKQATLTTMRAHGARVDRLRTGFNVEAGEAVDIETVITSLDSVYPLFRLDLSGARIRDSGLDVLARHPEIRVLDLSRTGVRAEALNRMPGHSELRELLAGGTEIDDAVVCMGVSRLRLSVLDLSGCPVSDDGVACIGAAEGALQQSIVTLNLSHTRITSASVAHILKCRRVEYLNISNTAVSDEAVGALAEMNRLSSVHLAGLRISNAGVSRLVDLMRTPERLRALNINRTDVDDRAIDAITKLRGLRELRISGTRITPSGIQRAIRLPSLDLLEVDRAVVSEVLETEIIDARPGMRLEIVR